MPAFNTGSRPNPLVGRIDDLFEIGVRQYFFRQVPASSGNF
jgi:hypothetical protein